MKFDYQPDGGATYTTSEGDCLDLVAYHFYGTHEGTTVLLYQSNRDIALIEQPYPAGVQIYLPPRVVPKAPTQIQLWE